MDLNVESEDSKIKQIEDIIDIQKANGNINVRQVAFNLPSDTDSSVSATLVRSLESGLSNIKSKKHRKKRHKRSKSLLPEVVSWPSDSDVTVLRMKLYLTNALKEEGGNVISGDGLHQPDCSSMINLATLMLQSQPPSRHSLINEEYLLPLSSWEPTSKPESKDTTVNGKNNHFLTRNFDTYKVITSQRHSAQDKMFSSENNLIVETNMKAKLARFLRLYFCPCCTCLYELENMRNEPSSYFTTKETD